MVLSIATVSKNLQFPGLSKKGSDFLEERISYYSAKSELSLGFGFTLGGGLIYDNILDALSESNPTFSIKPTLVSHQTDFKEQITKKGFTAPLRDIERFSDADLFDDLFVHYLNDLLKQINVEKEELAISLNDYITSVFTEEFVNKLSKNIERLVKCSDYPSLSITETLKLFSVKFFVKNEKKLTSTLDEIYKENKNITFDDILISIVFTPESKKTKIVQTFKLTKDIIID